MKQQTVTKARETVTAIQAIFAIILICSIMLCFISLFRGIDIDMLSLATEISFFGFILFSCFTCISGLLSRKITIIEEDGTRFDI